MKQITSIDELIAFEGQKFITEPHRFSAEELEKYLTLSQDQTPIHSPDLKNQAIIPGNMIVMKLPALLQSCFRIALPHDVVTTGYEKITFRTPLKCEENFIAKINIQRLRQRAAQFFVHYQIDIVAPDADQIYASVLMKDCYTISTKEGA